MSDYPHPAIDRWWAEVTQANGKTQFGIARSPLDLREYDFQRGIIAGRQEALRMMDQAIRELAAPAPASQQPAPPTEEELY